MEFIYQAKKSLNEVISGRIEAESLEQAIESLSQQGLIPVSVQPAHLAARQKKRAQNLRLGKWSSRQITLFTQKLYNLIKSRVELLNALKLLEEQSGNPTEKFLLQDMIKTVKDGMTFSECLQRYPKYFSPLFINVVRTGENSGQLKESLLQLLSQLQRMDELRLKVRQALAYPIFMVIVGAGTIFVMLAFILPRLASMFEDFQSALPLPTRILLGSGELLREYWWAIAIAVGLLFIILRLGQGAKGSLFGRIKYYLPLVKGLVYKQAVANFSTSLSLLLASGVNLLQALDVAAPVIGNPEYIQQLSQVRQNIKEGASFSNALARFKIFPDFFLQMIRIGEEGGRLDSVLLDISDAYQQEIESDLRIISSLLEPAIILVLGLVIGGMVMAVLLPIFNINALVGS